jgi:hypothetical protein
MSVRPALLQPATAAPSAALVLLLALATAALADGGRAADEPEPGRPPPRLPLP